MDLVAGLRKRAWRRRDVLTFARPSLSARPNRARSRSPATTATSCTSTGARSARARTGKCSTSTTSPSTWCRARTRSRSRRSNAEQGSAGLVARVVVKQQGDTHVEHSTDATWKTALKEFPQWQKARFNDTQWLAARSFGALGATLPWGNEVTAGRRRRPLQGHARVPRRMGHRSQGHRLADLHDVRRVRPDHRLARKRAADHHSRRRRDGLVDTVSTYCERTEELPGPAGRQRQGLRHRRGAARARRSTAWRTKTRTATSTRSRRSLKFAGEMGEHGPHALTLGPDGLLYMIVGNFSHAAPRSTSRPAPTTTSTKATCSRPRYEDASGHAVGIKAPGRLDPAHRHRRQRRRTVRRRTAESLRPGLQPGRRTVHLRLRHGMGLGHALVSADAAEPRRAGCRVRLAERLGQVARLFRRQPAAGGRSWAAARRPASKFYNHSHVSAALSQCAVRLRLVARADPGHPHEAARRHLQGHRPRSSSKVSR